jgi:hypothetical protein
VEVYGKSVGVCLVKGKEAHCESFTIGVS